MKRIKQLLPILGILALVSCKSYNEKEYGPISFETAFEDGDDMLFEGPAEAVATIPFKPEEFGFSKSSVGGMQLKSITIKTNNPEGFGVFENLKIDVSSENTSSLTIGVLNDVPNGNTITIDGLESAKIKNFNQVDEFYLLIEGNLTTDLDDVFDVSGDFTLIIESTEE